MKIAIDVSPLSSGHSIRGVGFYLKNLLEGLKEYHPENIYVEFSGEAPKNVDLIHYPYFDPFSLTLPLLKSIKTVVTVHDLTPLLLPKLFPIGIKGRMIWLLQKQRLRMVDRILTDSDSSKRDIARLANVRSEKIDKIYLAAADHFKVVKNKRELESLVKKFQLPKKFSLYVGDVTPNKNLPRLVKASLETNIPLVMVGRTLVDQTVQLGHPWTRDLIEVRKLAKQNPDKILLLGFVSDNDLVGLYNLATVFVMPSLYEGFGLPVLEAYCSGCPVITSSKGSLKEIGAAALTVDPENSNDISSGIKRVIGDSKLRDRMIQAGLAKSKEFSWKKTIDQTITAYQNTLLHI